VHDQLLIFTFLLFTVCFPVNLDFSHNELIGAFDIISYHHKIMTTCHLQVQQNNMSDSYGTESIEAARRRSQ